MQRRVLVLRTGLGNGSPMSVNGVAKALGVPSSRVLRAQRAGLRGLRRANRSDGCAMGSPQPAMARDVRAALAVATAPPLASVAQLADAATKPGPSTGADGGAVLGQRAVSTSPSGSGRAPLGTAAAVPTSADAGTLPPPFLLIMLLLASFAVGTALLLRRRGMRPHHRAIERVAGAPFVAEPVRPRPSPAATPPGPSYPPVSPPDGSANGGPGSRGVRRAAGIAASGAASVLLGLALRALRRR